jgi:hypothetical protein
MVARFPEGGSMNRLMLLFITLLAAGCAAPLSQVPPAGLPAQVTAPAAQVGDRWIYSSHDGYTGLPRGRLDFRVTSLEGDEVTVEFDHDGRRSTQRYTRDGNWRERPMTNLQNFRYDPAYLALPFPLEAGKSWQAYVRATDPATGRVNRVRIDGKVLGWERVKVPAGEFDAIVVRRQVYAGNDDTSRGEEIISEADWYAPRLGGIVRHSASSAYFDKMGSCDNRACNAWVKNDWSIAELERYPAR